MARVSSQVKATLVSIAGHDYGFQRIEDFIKLLYAADEYEEWTSSKRKGKGVKQVFVNAAEQERGDWIQPKRRKTTQSGPTR